jgi:hypothetical protein
MEYSYPDTCTPAGSPVEGFTMSTKGELRRLRKLARQARQERRSMRAVDEPDDTDTHGPAIEFTESAAGYRARDRWARHYDDLNGAPEGDWDR